MNDRSPSPAHGDVAPPSMSARERVRAALRGDEVDRPPVSFWGHFYHRESTPLDLVEATLEHQNEYDWDWIKLNPRKHIHVEDWGVRYRYSGRAGEKPILDAVPVHQPQDWAAITPRSIDRGALAEQVDAVALLRRRLPEVPILQTVFTPLAVLGAMGAEPGELRLHMRTHPNAVRGAIEAVTETFERLVPRILEAGADGAFFAPTHRGARTLLSAEECDACSRPYDLRVLAAARGAPFNVLHVCKRRNLVLETADYPV